MSNIYQKQMNKLKLNAKQYAELTNMPYEVVKNFIYEKEGDYSMEIKNLLRNDMLKKHQEIENNFENAKLTAMQYRTNVYDWYINEFSKEMLEEKLNIKTVIDFENKYDIIIDDKKASHWFYTCILSKRNYDNHEIRKDVVIQFAKQLYDILVNDNGNKYLSKTKTLKTTNKIKWFKKFDVKNYLKENNITQLELSKKLNMNVSTLNRLLNNKRVIKYETESLKRLYDYINNTSQVITTCDKKETIEIVPNNDIMKKILISRLTEEEKALIELFGGKIC